MFPPETLWYLSGRIALKRILVDIQKKQSVKTVALPAWCCDSMILPFVEAGLQVRFYPVYVRNGQLVQDISGIGECDVLFLMDYFGYSCSMIGTVVAPVVIRDVTHSIFSAEHSDADYYFGSLRKWAGFFTGGFAWGDSWNTSDTDPVYTGMRRSAMEAKFAYIRGESESKEYLVVFSEAEEYLEHCGIAGADPRDIRLAEFMDVKFIKTQRRKNASVLLEYLSSEAIFSNMQEMDCPMFVPILVPDGRRDELRRYLIGQQIYCPVHWPLSAYHDPDCRTMHIYRNELSIVCDQRYNEKDMERIVQAIRTF